MRTGSAGNTRRSEPRQARSTSRLAELKRSVQNLHLQKKRVGVLQNLKGTSMRELKKGKLVLGQNSKPIMVLSRDERLNPWGKRATISEQLLNKKGLMSLFAMGVVTHQANCHDLLNNRYEMAVQQKILALPIQKQLFMTNPVALMNNEPSPQLPSDPQVQKKNYTTQQIKLKRKSSRKKIVKQAQPKFQLPEQITHLLIVNFHIEHNDAYIRCLKRVKCNGMQPFFKTYIVAFQNFAIKYNLRKITIIPALNETRRLTESYILNSIVNHKIYGIDMKLKGDPALMFVNLLRGKVQSLRFARMQLAVALLNRFKKFFKIKKFYQEMIVKRWRFVNFKLESFMENQRRLVEDNRGAVTRPQVEIHILASDLRVGQLQSYYKWGERKKIQLTRLYNNQCSHLVLILNRRQQIAKWVSQIEQCPSNWKKPVVHIFFSSLEEDKQGTGIEGYADIYFGLLPATIKSIKQICWGRTAVVVPSRISNYLPKLCEALGANLFAGTFTQSSKLALIEEEQVQLQQKNVQAKFKKVSSGGKQVNEFYHRRFRQIKLRAEMLQSKDIIKELFLQLGLSTPLSLSMGLSYDDFLRDLSRCILVNKRYNRWILKLPNSTFSRGLALLETDSLKIIKEAKKKAVIKEEDVDQISKIMDSVLVQKISIPHSSLLNGEEFMALFKRGGYIQGYLDNCATICVFGRIQLNGSFTLLGTCRKYYAEGICFGALYPSTDVRPSILLQIKQACRNLYLSSMFGYITFELLLDQKTKQFYFIDLVPHLQQYSSLYFYYRRVLDMSEAEVQAGRLSRRVFYCPFIDNNGNRCQSVEQFNELRSEKKVVFDQVGLQGTQFFFLNEGVPDVLSMVCFGKDEGVVIRQCLEGLNFLVQIGGEFNKFDKKYKSIQSDGLYIMDIIWKLRQLKKEYSDK